MKKVFLKNAGLYLLTMTVFIHALQHGFSWLAIVAIGLSLVAFMIGLVNSKGEC